jgi:type VI protein secretion system component Hcp
MASIALLQAFDQNGSQLLEGDSSIKDHVKWLELLAFSLKERSPSREKTATIVFSSDEDATTAIVEDQANGRVYARAVIDLFKGAAPDVTWYLRIEFKEPTFGTVSVGKQTGTDVPAVTADLSYGQMALTFRSPEAGPPDGFRDAQAIDWSMSVDGPL